MRKAVRTALWVALAMSAVGFALALCVKSSFSTSTVLVPPGHYATGRMEFDWIDEARPDPFASDAKRELDTFLWYPAEKRGGNPAICLRGNWSRNLEPPIRWAGYYRGRTSSRESAAPLVCSVQKSWPVVVLSTGFDHIPADYTSLAEALASEGYVVATPANTYTGATVVYPDGRIAKNRDDASDLKRTLHVWTEDIGTVLKRLEALNADTRSAFFHRLDFSRIAIVGHSFGGDASAEFCANEAQCTAGVDLDGSLFGDAAHKGIRRPFLFLLSGEAPPWWTRLLPGHKHSWEELRVRDMTRFRAACRVSSYCSIESVPGMRHENFSDFALVFRAPLYWVHPKLGHAGGEQGLRITRQKVIEFLNRWVRG